MAVSYRSAKRPLRSTNCQEKLKYTSKLCGRYEKREALLPQMDCVTSSVSCQLLHNYRNKLLKKSRTPKWWSYRVTVDWHVVNSYDASTVVGVVNKLSHRRVLLTTQSTCRGKYCKSRVCVKVPEESTLIFRGTQISLQHSVGQMDGSSMPKPALIRDCNPRIPNLEIPATFSVPKSWDWMLKFQIPRFWDRKARPGAA